MMYTKNDGGMLKDAYLTWTEAEFTAAVIADATAAGWLVFHARPARTTQGWRTAMSGEPGSGSTAIEGD